MAKKREIGFRTKILSNYNYLKEVPVDGKKTNRFNFAIGHYDQYVAKIIRIGNCITLLSNNFEITDESFWNPSHFENISRYIFFTFNKSFLIKLIEKIESLQLSVLKRSADLLRENPIPYNKTSDEFFDEELKWCIVKNSNLKKDHRFKKMYTLDLENRLAILTAIEKRIENIQKVDKTKQLNINETKEKEITKALLLQDVLRPMNGSTKSTMEFIKAKMIDTKYEYDIFSPVSKLENGKNQYGLNGCMAAMIDFFYQHNYFKKEYTLIEIFKAYLNYSGNSIAKLKPFISGFREDKSFVKYYERLTKLKISKLQ
jgi:hypothetical protein